MRKNKIQRLIEKNNKLMANATKSEKRVIIAKDALSQIRSGNFEAEASIWADVHGDFDLDSTCSAQEQLLKSDVSCNGCALGSILVSAIRLSNQVSVDEFDELTNQKTLGEQIEKNNVPTINDIFTKSQLILIENAFEGCSGYFRHNNKTLNYSERLSNRIYKFTSKYLDMNDRLIAILENIIRNNGTFKL